MMIKYLRNCALNIMGSYNGLVIVLLCFIVQPYTFSDVEIINNSGKNLLLGYKGTENTWKLKKKERKKYSFKDTIWFTLRKSTTTGSFLRTKDWGEDNLEKIEILKGKVNGVGYRVQVKIKNEGWYCFQEDVDNKCSNAIHIHQKTKGIDGTEKKLKNVFGKKSLKFYPLTKANKQSVIVSHRGGNSGIRVSQSNNRVRKLSRIKNRRSVLDFNNSSDNIVLMFTGKFSGEKGSGILFDYDGWKEDNRILRIEKFSDRLLIHTLNNGTYCYGSKCQCKEKGLKLGGKTSDPKVSYITRTNFAACPAILAGVSH